MAGRSHGGDAGGLARLRPSQLWGLAAAAITLGASTMANINNAIRMPARSARTWFSRPQGMRLSQAHLIGGREAGTAAAGGWVLPIRQHLPVG
jgi:hypothetical protein